LAILQDGGEFTREARRDGDESDRPFTRGNCFGIRRGWEKNEAEPTLISPPCFNACGTHKAQP